MAGLVSGSRVAEVAGLVVLDLLRLRAIDTSHSLLAGTVLVGLCGWGIAAEEGPVQGLFTASEAAGGEPVKVPPHVAPFQAVYFSVVTMTTLGFGDLTAHPTSITGHLLLMTQVFLGYVLLGALITRFAIMFQGGVGPVPKVPPAEGPIRQDSPWWQEAYQFQRFRTRLIRFVGPILLRTWHGGGN